MIQSFALMLRPKKLVPSLPPGALFPPRCTAQLVAGLWLVVHSTADTTSSVVIPTNKVRTGIFSSVGQLRLRHPKADWLGCFCLSNRTRREKGWGWGTHPQTALDAPTAVGGIRSKGEWERTGPSFKSHFRFAAWWMFSLNVCFATASWIPASSVTECPLWIFSGKPWSLLISGKIAYNAISDTEMKTHCF